MNRNPVHPWKRQMRKARLILVRNFGPIPRRGIRARVNERAMGVVDVLVNLDYLWAAPERPTSGDVG